MAEPTAETRILAAIRAIPRGQVAGYGHVSTRAGLPGRARLVARVLANHDEVDLPWHRVLRSDGRIAFPEGSRGRREQTHRLRAEGVIVSNGRVRMAGEAQGLDAAIWGDLMQPADDGAKTARRRTASRDEANRSRVR